MYSIRKVFNIWRAEYNISEIDRIRYQLHKQKLSLSQLLELRDETGRNRTEEEIALYRKAEGEDIYGKTEKSKYARYMSKMPRKAYLELCKRLRINPEIELAELEEIKVWKSRLEAENISYKKRKEALQIYENNNEHEKTKALKENTKPTKAITYRRQYLASDVEDIAKGNLYLEEERMEIEQEKIDAYRKTEFIQYVKGVSTKVLSLWYEYSQFFSANFYSELYFF